MNQLDNGINQKPRTKCGHVQLIKLYRLYLRQIEDHVKDTNENWCTYVFIVSFCPIMLFRRIISIFNLKF